MVEHVLAKDETGVRFSLAAHIIVNSIEVKNLIKKIPKEVSYVTDTLEKDGFEAYLVGGCVRDLLMDREPKDWDITTNAKPEDNMHPWKLKRMSRTIQTYLLSKNVPDEKEWQVDLLVIFLDIKNKKAKIKMVSDIIL